MMQTVTNEVQRGKFLSGWQLIKEAYGAIVATVVNEAKTNYNSTKRNWIASFGFVLSRRRWYWKIITALILTLWCVIWSLFMLTVTVIKPLFVPIGGLCVIGFILAYIDYVTYPTNQVNPEFNNPENASLTVDQKGALLFRAAYHQMDTELNSTLGWCPNDLPVWPPKWLDNRCNRQKGVWYATKRAVLTLSEKITKFGTGDSENEDTKNAHLHLGNFPDQWGAMGAFQDASENHFSEAIRLLQKFEADAKKSASTQTSGVLINARTDDFVAMMAMLVADGGILTEPYGGLTSRNETVAYSELDDRVYYAQGAAIVARDLAVAMRSMYEDELSRGGLDNLDAAIEALNSAAAYNPPWISRGDSSSWWTVKFADDRSKMQRYLTEAFRRIEDLKESLKN